MACFVLDGDTVAAGCGLQTAFDGTPYVQPDDTLPHGSHFYYVIVSDPAGNQTVLDTVTFAIRDINCGDTNSDVSIDLADAVYLINYVFKGGPPPVEPCCP